MAFPQKLLNEGEDVVLDLRPHWWVFAGPTALTVMALVLAVALSRIFSNAFLTYVALALLLVAVLRLLLTYARWASTSFVVTTDRLVTRTGVLSRHSREIPLDRLNDISFHQSLFQRMIGAGDLLIESAGERGQETFAGLPRPSQVQNVIYREVERSKARDADRLAGRRELSVPEQLEKLDELRRRGVLTQAEFDAKKAQLLERM